MGKGFTEIEGLFRVGERIFEERDYAVLMACMVTVKLFIWKKRYSKDMTIGL